MQGSGWPGFQGTGAWLFEVAMLCGSGDRWPVVRGCRPALFEVWVPFIQGTVTLPIQVRLPFFGEKSVPFTRRTVASFPGEPVFPRAERLPDFQGKCFLAKIKTGRAVFVTTDTEGFKKGVQEGRVGRGVGEEGFWLYRLCGKKAREGGEFTGDMLSSQGYMFIFAGQISKGKRKPPIILWTQVFSNG